MFLIMLSTVLILAMLAPGVVDAEVIRTPESPPEGTIVYRDYSTEDLVQLVTLLYQFHRHSEAVEAGTEALRRDLTQDQDAFVRLKMANSYEFVPKAGALAKEKYREILERHPSYEQNIAVAMRLGQLNDHIILRNTERNVPLALEYFNYVIDNYDDPNTDTFNLEVMQTHIHLGNIYSLQGDYDKSNIHYDRIYNCDPNQAMPLPYRTFESQKDSQSHKNRLKGRTLMLKDQVKHNLVNNCIRSKPEVTISELGKLKDKYASDSLIVELADAALTQVLNEVFDLKKVVDEFLNEID
ncbi:MAG: hypothetical protein ACYS1A_17290 [Planctomycetota bacterium]